MYKNLDVEKKSTGKPLMFDFAEQKRKQAMIKVVGIGGGGGNAVDRMINDGLGGVDFITMNTDLQALEINKAGKIIQLGKKLTRGLGAGGDPEIGRKAVEENKDEVIEILAETEMVFLACGMGGGTGTGASPVVAEIAKDLGILTIGIVTKPFDFEGVPRMNKALSGIDKLRTYVDTLIVVPNQKLFEMVPEKTPLGDAFMIADQVLLHATKGISDLIYKPGLVNLDFADIKNTMWNMGDALMGSGIGTGECRGKEAAEQAILSPLIDDDSIKGAKGTIINITGGKDMNLIDINEATSVVFNEVGAESKIIFGAVIDPEIKDEISVTVIATGLAKSKINTGYSEKINSNPEINKHVSLQEQKCDIPYFQKMESEPLEQTMGDFIGNDGNFLLTSDSSLDVPTFIRKRDN